MVLDKAIKVSAKYLKENKITIDSSARDLEQAISDHITQVTTWSHEITFKDLSKSKLTSKVLKNKNGLKVRPFCSARDEIRTHTPFRALPPQSSASTNFATHASIPASRYEILKWLQNYGFQFNISKDPAIFSGSPPLTPPSRPCSPPSFPALRSPLPLQGHLSRSPQAHFFSTILNVVPFPGSDCFTYSCPL